MLATLALLAFSVVTTASAYANPGACSGTCVNTHDPAVIRRSDGTYFRFSTGGTIQIHTAPEITGPWTFACTMLGDAAKLTVTDNPGTDLWAPDVALVDDLYYVYYSVSSFGTQESAIGVATSSSMDCGTFTDLGATGVASHTGSRYNAIDPNLVNTGSAYELLFGSFWQNLFIVGMSDPPTSPSGSSVQVAYDPAGTHAVEGGFMINTNGYYYLFFSAGQCCGYDS